MPLNCACWTFKSEICVLQSYFSHSVPSFKVTNTTEHIAWFQNNTAEARFTSHHFHQIFFFLTYWQRVPYNPSLLLFSIADTKQALTPTCGWLRAVLVDLKLDMISSVTSRPSWFGSRILICHQMFGYVCANCLALLSAMIESYPCLQPVNYSFFL